MEGQTMDTLSLINVATWLVPVYAALVTIGGIIGYTKSKSKISLIAGLGSGAALAIAALQPPVMRFALAALIAALLLVVFVVRFFKTRAFMPAGLMAILSGAASTLFILCFFANQTIR